MKKVILSSLIALATVSANAGVYIGGYLGTNSSKTIDLFDRTYLFGTVGYAFENGIRLETDILTKTIISDSTSMLEIGGNINYTPVVNSIKALYDFKLGAVTPYVGLGFNSIDWISTPNKTIGSFTIKGNDTFHLGGSFIVGASYALSPKWSVDLQYNRGYTFDYTFNSDDSKTTTAGSNIWKLGAVYKF